MLTGILQYERQSIELLYQTSQQLTQVQLQIDDLRSYLPIAIQSAILRQYYDEVRAAATNLRDVLPLLDKVKAAERKKLDANLENQYQQLALARGKLEGYPSFDAALAYPLCLAAETTLILATARQSLLKPRLKQYIEWGNSILDQSNPSSLAGSTTRTATAYLSSYEGNDKLDSRFVEVDCTAFPYQWTTHGNGMTWTLSSTMCISKGKLPSRRLRQDELGYEWYLDKVKYQRCSNELHCVAGTLVSMDGESALAFNKEMTEQGPDRAIPSPIISSNTIAQLGERLRASNEQLTLGDPNGKLLQIALQSSLTVAIYDAQNKAMRALDNLGG